MQSIERLYIKFGSDGGNITRLDCSNSPSDQEKEFADALKNYFQKRHGDNLRKKGFMAINFDVKRSKREFIVKGVYLIKDDGSVKYHTLDIEHKFPLKTNTIVTDMRKVGAKMVKQLPIGKLGAVVALGIGLFSFVSNLLNINGFSRIGATLVLIIGLYTAFVCWKADSSYKE